MLLGEVAEAAEEIIRRTCKELDIEVIDMAVMRKSSKIPISKSKTEEMFRVVCGNYLSHE